jgi:5-formyltetrahydrofolate cyclo-ligase
MKASQDKSDMRRSLRQLRKDYVAQLASNIEGEYTRLADFALPLANLLHLVQSDAAPSHTDQRARIVIASYKSQHSEIHPKYLEEALMMLGHTIVWPRVEGEYLRFFSNDDVPAFVKGAHGLMEPGPQASEKKPDIILLPLLGFDAQGQRLGQGGGYYDRTLERLNAEVLAIGVAWDCQQVSTVPIEGHDMPLAGVITPSTFHRF